MTMSADTCIPISWNLCFLCSSELPLSVVKSESEGKNADNNVTLDFDSRWKTMLQYLLLHGETRQGGNDNHKIYNSILELAKVREEGNKSYLKICCACDKIMELVTNLQLSLEVTQMKIVEKIKAVTDLVISNSRLYGQNLKVKQFFDSFEKELHQEEANGVGVQSQRQILEVLHQFQTYVFEHDFRTCNIPLVHIGKLNNSVKYREPTKNLIELDPTEAIQVIVKEEVGSGSDLDLNSYDDHYEYYDPCTQYSADSSSENIQMQLKRKLACQTEQIKRKRGRPKREENKTTMITTKMMQRKRGGRKASRKKTTEKADTSTVLTDAAADGLSSFQSNCDDSSDIPPEKRKRARISPLEKIKRKSGRPKGLVKKIPDKLTEAQCLFRKMKKNRPKGNGNRSRLKNGKLTRNKVSIMVTCQVCRFFGKNTSSLEQHLRTHETPVKTLKCPECSMEFSQSQLFELHLFNFCGAVFWKCDICKMKPKRSEMISHLESVHQVSSLLKCDFCNCRFASFIGLVVHCQWHIGFKRKCNLCSNPEEIGRQKMLKHLCDTHGHTELQIFCKWPNCSKVFYDREYYYQHTYYKHKEHKHYDVRSNCKKKPLPSVTHNSTEQNEDQKIVKGKETEIANIPGQKVLTEAQRLFREIQTNRPKHRRRLLDNGKTNKEGITVKCQVCGFFGKLIPILEQHLRTHETSEKTQKCPECLMEFSQRQLFELHLSSSCGAVNWRCDICKKSFKRSEMMSHLESIHQVSNLLKCYYCSCQFASFVGLVLHCQLHTGVKIKCNLCSDPEEMNRRKMLKHLCEIHGHTELQITCKWPNCSEVFFDKMSYYEHSNLRHKYKMRVCKSSSKEIKKRKDYVCKGKNLCEICGHIARTQFQLQHHKSLIHLGEGGLKRFACELCPKTFFSGQGLKEHQVSHTQEFPYQCDICGSWFTMFSSLNRHIKKFHVLGTASRPGPWTLRKTNGPGRKKMRDRKSENPVLAESTLQSQTESVIINDTEAQSYTFSETQVVTSFIPIPSASTPSWPGGDEDVMKL